MDNPETLPTLGTRETGRNNDRYCITQTNVIWESGNRLNSRCYFKC